jgi:transposase
MITLKENQKIFIAVEPVDFRQGIDRLKQYCKSTIKKDPQSGALFIFKNKRNFSIKILVYDGEAIWLCMRRLSKGKIIVQKQLN